MRAPWVWCVLVGCAAAPAPDGPSGERDAEPIGAEAAGSAMLRDVLGTTLVPGLVRGQQATYTVAGATPGEEIHLVGSFAGTGAGPCPPLLGGLCLGVSAPVTHLGSRVADVNGMATFTGLVPAGLPAGALFSTQVVVRRGAGGATSVASVPRTDRVVDQALPLAHPRIWVSDPVTLGRWQAALQAGDPQAVRFRDMVDRAVAGTDFYDYSAADSALMYQLTGDPLYADDAVARIDAFVAAEEALIANGERPTVAYDSYLYAGHVLGDLALVDDWCHDRVTPGQQRRWRDYANQALANVWDPDDATWGGLSFPWSGWGTDDPMNNYHYSFLRATMMVGLDTWGEEPEGDVWLAMFRDDKLPALIDVYETELVGGGSREGTGYGTALRDMWEIHAVWSASTGDRSGADSPYVFDSLVHEIHAITPTLDRLVPVGDQARDSTASLFDYHREYLLELGTLVGPDPVVEATRTLLADCSVPEMTQYFEYRKDYTFDLDPTPALPLDTLFPAYHGEGTGNVYWRSGWDPQATFVHLIAGPYTQSHAHRDQGSFLLFDEEWLAWDQNAGTHSGIQQGEEYHNLVRFSDAGATVPQREGTAGQVVGLQVQPGWSWVGAVTTDVYADARVDHQSRDLVMLDEGALVVFDRSAVDAGVTSTWQLNTPLPPTVLGSVATLTGTSKTVDVRFVSPAATPAVFPWGGQYDIDIPGWRLEVPSAARLSSFLVVLSVDGAVTGLTSSGDSQVSLTLASGATLEVTFDPTSPGGTLRFDGGAPVALGGVEVLPVLAP